MGREQEHFFYCFIQKICLFYQKCMNKINRMLIYVFRILPINNSLILFESEGDLSDNCYALYEYMRDNGGLNSYKVVWLVDDIKKWKNTQQNVAFIEKTPHIIRFKRNLYLATFKFYLYDHCNLVYGLKSKAGQKVVYLTHGGILKKHKGVSKIIDCNDEQYITGPLFIPGIKDWTNTTDDKIFDLGFPRNDYLFKEISPNVKDFLKECFRIDYCKLLIWMPTYRTSKNKRLNEQVLPSFTGLPIIHSEKELEELNQFLSEKKCACIMKPHHLQLEMAIFRKNYSNILFITDTVLQENNIQLYQLLKATDALITDFSSVGFDYLLMEKPIIRTLDDIEQYNSSRGFVVNPFPYLNGYRCENLEEFKKAIAKVIDGCDEFKSERKQILSQMHTHIDGNSSKRIVEHLGL